MNVLHRAVQDVRRALAEPVELCRKLQLAERAQRQAGGLLICCPVHGERHPSCSVTRGPDGTVRVRCFACDFTADAIGLVAQVLGLPTRGDGFRETLAEAAELGGLLSLAGELRGHKPAQPHQRPPVPMPLPERDYPPADQVEQLWSQAGSVADDTDSSGTLVARRIDPDRVAAGNLARVLAPASELPPWAAYRGVPWTRSSHRLLVRAFDSQGELRSVRAWRVLRSEAPKRLPPAGHKAAELVLANRPGLGMLLGRTHPKRVLVVEGEPDWLVSSLRWPEDAVFGIGSGSWTRAFASRVSGTAEVIILTHPDAAGDRYAAHVTETLGERVRVWRGAA
jgi:hypothetical protein